jgi:dephospho-CoA kinase
MVQSVTSPRVVALTGGIGSGKSTAAHFLAECGATIVDADHLAREVVAPGAPALTEVSSLFGAGILSPDGSLDRKQLGALIFKDENARKKLEEIVHPRVRSLWLERLTELTRASTHPLIVYAVPLLFESGQSYPEIEKTVLIVAPEAERIARIVARDKISPEEAKQRIAAQLSDEEKMKRCDLVLQNDCSVNELRERVRSLFCRLTAQQAQTATPPATD